MMLFVVLTFLFPATVMSSVINPCANNKGIRWVRDPTDCSVFYICYGSDPTKYDCPLGTVTDKKSMACVPKGSVLDTCKADPMPLEQIIPSKQTEAPKLTEPPKQVTVCDRSAKKRLPHSVSCAKFVDCANGLPTTKECPYPLLFNDKTEECSLIEEVECGIRKEPKSPCDYESNQCKSSLCIPCHMRYPSCEGKPNGLNAWTGREWSPHFVVCRNDRVAYQGQCSFGGPVVIFDPEKKKCVEN